MKKSVIAIPSVIVITSLVYALVVTTFFEMNNNNALGEGEENFVDITNYDKIYTQ